MMNYIWPEFFSDIDAPFHPELDEFKRRGAAIACGNSAWGGVLAGNVPPSTFGNGLVKLGEIASMESCTHEAFSAAARTWLAQSDDARAAHRAAVEAGGATLAGYIRTYGDAK